MLQLRRITNLEIDAAALYPEFIRVRGEAASKFRLGHGRLVQQCKKTLMVSLFECVGCLTSGLLARALHAFAESAEAHTRQAVFEMYGASPLLFLIDVASRV